MIGRRKVLKTSGKLLAGGAVLGTATSPVSAGGDDLHLAEDFEKVLHLYIDETHEGAVIDGISEVYQPKSGTGLDPEYYRVVHVVLDLNAAGLNHNKARIQIKGKNGATIAMLNNRAAVVPSGSIGSQSYFISLGAGVSADSLSVTASQTMARSDLHISNKTKPEQELCDIRYDFGGDIPSDYVAIDATAVFYANTLDIAEEFVEVDWIVDLKDKSHCEIEPRTNCYYDKNILEGTKSHHYFNH
ncbi:hypothetical protein SVXHr_0908 [Halorhabdus sp. SVX81]|uniref:hypothetical protein n=1 Tax=Halorhabdus sp. SVX81 TaxID=2978283 RepID=UPI0023DB75BC|nr:hypothetical protein [Halorhabdus sp. SVX81]WEL17083.1 hypothetical protein SVXHr_0908 [Halorhabdus sp. SVX81]